MTVRRFVNSRTLVLFLALAAALLLVAGCGSDDTDKDSSKKSDDSSQKETSGGGDSGSDADLDKKVAKRADSYKSAPSEKLDATKKYEVELDTDKGTIKIAVDPKVGPIAAANFVFLVKEGFYDGVKFHRILDDFMIQTGDPTGTGMSGPGYTIKDDDVKGTYERGVVAMANAGPDTGGSQFFIVQGSAVQLPPDYSIFGKVTDKASLATVDKIAGVKVEAGPNGEPSSPTKPVRIRTAKLVDA